MGRPLRSEAECHSRLEDIRNGTTRVQLSRWNHAFNPLRRALFERRERVFISKDTDRLIKDSLATGGGYVRTARAKAAAKAALR